MRWLLWKRLAKVKKSLKEAKSVQKIADILQHMWELESQLNSDYAAVNDREEDEAIFRIKSNPKSFFSFAKSRQKQKSRLALFLMLMANQTHLLIFLLKNSENSMTVSLPGLGKNGQSLTFHHTYVSRWRKQNPPSLDQKIWRKHVLN